MLIFLCHDLSAHLEKTQLKTASVLNRDAEILTVLQYRSIKHT